MTIIPGLMTIIPGTIASRGFATNIAAMENLYIEHSPHPFSALRAAAGDGGDDFGEGNGSETGVITRAKPKTRKPSLYKVLILNDDYTPMEFVVHIIQQFFNKSSDEATEIMLHVHQNGVGLCGVFTYEVAETKVTQVVDFARQNQHPLQCTMERD